ncbi:hypothetical protein [Hymenobacter sp.]|jgi:hypothetical protein|uniref:hypothetical protein n=1 Tax=Hymenobacter sp. TaxID=1898978 RepID=UPI002ED7943F
MKNIVCLLLMGVGLWAFRLAAADPVETKVYVISITGAEVHEKPSCQSKVLRKIPIGAAVNAQQTIASKEVKQVGAGFALQGDWIKVTAPAYTGYVFSSDVTKHKPKIESRDGLTFVDLLGTKKSARTENEKVAAANKNSAPEYAVHETTEYASGTYTMTTHDGCFDHVYSFRRLTLPEVYHHMISSYSGYSSFNPKKLMQPKLISRKGNVYTFTCGFGDSDAAQDLKLTVKDNGVITISSNDCT